MKNRLSSEKCEVENFDLGETQLRVENIMPTYVSGAIPSPSSTGRYNSL